MVYSIEGSGSNKIGIISGDKGAYGKAQLNSNLQYNDKNSIVFGRNAASNFYDYNKNYLGNPSKNGIDPNKPPEHEIKYMPENNNAGNGNFNTMSAMGYAYEDLKNTANALENFKNLAAKQGKQVPNVSLDWDEKDGSVSLEGMNILTKVARGNEFSYNAFDLDNNNRITPDEQVVNLFYTDMVKNPEAHNINGTITRTGDRNVQEILKENDAAKVKNAATDLHKALGLGTTFKKFLGLNKDLETNNTYLKKDNSYTASDHTGVYIENPDKGPVIRCPNGDADYQNQQSVDETEGIDNQNEESNGKTESDAAKNKDHSHISKSQLQKWYDLKNSKEKLEKEKAKANPTSDPAPKEVTQQNCPQVDTPEATTPAREPAAAPTEEVLKYKMKQGQGYGDVVIANRKLLEKKYGKTKLWGKNGLVEKFVKANNLDNLQDSNINKLKANQEYDFKF